MNCGLALSQIYITYVFLDVQFILIYQMKSDLNLIPKHSNVYSLGMVNPMVLKVTAFIILT